MHHMNFIIVIKGVLCTGGKVLSTFGNLPVFGVGIAV